MSLNCITDVSASLVTDWATSVYKGRMAYVICTEDAQMQPSFQNMSIEKSRGDWIISRLNAGHSPFLSCPSELTRVIVSLLDKVHA